MFAPLAFFNGQWCIGNSSNAGNRCSVGGVTCKVEEYMATTRLKLDLPLIN